MNWLMKVLMGEPKPIEQNVFYVDPECGYVEVQPKLYRDKRMQRLNPRRKKLRPWAIAMLKSKVQCNLIEMHCAPRRTVIPGPPPHVPDVWRRNVWLVWEWPEVPKPTPLWFWL